MLVDHYAYEDVFARVPQLAQETDPVLQQLDRLLEDDALVRQVRADLSRRYRLTLCHGRHSTPVTVLLRLLVVKHLFNWSYRETIARVADSLVLRWFCRVYFQPVPDATTLLRWALTIQPDTVAQLNDRVVQLARQARVTSGRKLRIDGTTVATAIHHPTHSSLLVDGVRVLGRVIRRSKPSVAERLAGVHDAFRVRLRTMWRGLQTLHRLRRRVGEERAERRRGVYERLLAATQATVRQAERIRTVLQSRRAVPDQAAGRLLQQLDHFLPLICRVIAQAERRVLYGEKVPAAAKLVSLFEPHTHILPQHKGRVTVEFGCLAVIDEVEGGLVSRFTVLEDKTGEQGPARPGLGASP